MKETGESGSTKNKTVILLLIILLTLLWFVGRDSGFLPLDESESVSGDGPEFAIYGYGYRCRIQDGGIFRIFMIMNSGKTMRS